MQNHQLCHQEPPVNNCVNLGSRTLQLELFIFTTYSKPYSFFPVLFYCMSLLFYRQIVIISWFIIISEQKCVLMAINVISFKFIMNRNLGMLTYDNWSFIHFFCLECYAVMVEYWRLELILKLCLLWIRGNLFTLSWNLEEWCFFLKGRMVFTMHHNCYQNNQISCIH